MISFPFFEHKNRGSILSRRVYFFKIMEGTVFITYLDRTEIVFLNITKFIRLQNLKRNIYKKPTF